MLRECDKSRYLRLPQIPNAEVTLLWDFSYYDLPLEGVAEWRGELLWFDSIAEEIPQQKEFFLVRLPATEMAKVKKIQELREQFHGSGNGHDERCIADESLSSVESYEALQERLQTFLESSGALPQPDLNAGEVIGWCRWKESETATNE